MCAFLAFSVLAVIVVKLFLDSRSRWATFWWFPLTGIAAGLGFYLFVSASDGLPMAPGPGGGGEGIRFLVVSAARLAVLILLVGCIVIRPRGAAWNYRVAIPAFAACSAVGVAVFLVDRHVRQVTIMVQVLDTNGTPVPAATVTYRWSPEPRSRLESLRQRKGTAVADDQGRVRLDVSRFKTLYLSVGEVHDGQPEQRVAFYSDFSGGDGYNITRSWNSAPAVPGRRRDWDVQQVNERMRAATKLINVTVELQRRATDPVPYPGKRRSGG